MKKWKFSEGIFLCTFDHLKRQGIEKFFQIFKEKDIPRILQIIV